MPYSSYHQRLAWLYHITYKGMTWGFRNVYVAALHWYKYVTMLHGYADRMPRWYPEFRYEDLLLQPEITMRTLEHFITWTHENHVTRRYLKDNITASSYRVYKWRNDMSLRSQEIFETVAGDTLLRYGYPLTGMTGPRISDELQV